MKFNKIISALLAVLMLLSSFSILAYAEGEGEEQQAPVYEYNTSEMQPVEYFTGKVIKEIKVDKEKGTTTITYETDKSGNPVIISTPEQKLETMDLRLEKDGYQLYVDAYSGEVATRCIATGEILFSNPYDVATASGATDAVKAELMSQLAVTFTTITSGVPTTYYSYTWAAQREQIKVKNIKNGLRVEYSIGREQSKMLVPILIEASSFEKNIKTPLMEGLGEDSFDYSKFEAFYEPKSSFPQATLDELYKKYPNLKNMDFYMLINLKDQEKLKLEAWIKTFSPDYSYEDMDEDHLKVGYESTDENPPLFKMALEYTIDSEGLTARLPANGIRFNESLYRLDSIQILPYMGAAANPDSGYTFFPDGSGALFDFQKIKNAKSSYSVEGMIYGEDYAYHNLTATHQENIRYPVFGLVDDQTLERTVLDENGKEVQEEYVKTRGFFAIIEEGDAMMKLKTSHDISKHNYNTVIMSVFPRPQDTYNMADAISVGSNTEMTVVSSRKYTGVYKIRYTLLTSQQTLAEKELDSALYYDASYLGMARLYRDYLTSNGTLTKLTAEDVKQDIPLYIETFGTIQTTEKFLSIPVDVMTPLTSFEDIKAMYDGLANEGITNINFIMTGYANGGMFATVPYKLDWENAVGGDNGFEELVAYAKEKGFGLYPDFDFAFVSSTGSFDGLNLKKHVVKTIDNRYASKREYSATKQTHISYFELAISPAYFSHFYEKFTDRYLKYSPIGISVSSLGSYLNSDFDEDEPYNREDGKRFTAEAFQYFDEKYDNVMTSAGNAYTWKYVDYITDIALDSSRYARAGASIPFLGLVLHGNVQFAGTAINMEGNIDYALLKAIENGAGLNFILSYRNTENLKDSQVLSKYYSVRYDIWFDDVVSIYHELNSLLKGVQTSFISDHRFVEGTRIPDADELDSDAKTAMKEAIALEKEILDAADESDRILIRDAYNTLENKYGQLETLVNNIKTNRNNVISDLYSLEKLQAELDLLAEMKAKYETATEDEKMVIGVEINTQISIIRDFATGAYLIADNLLKAVADMKADAEYAQMAYDVLAASDSYTDAMKADAKVWCDAIVAAYESVKELDTECVTYLQTSFFEKISTVEEANVKIYELPTDEELVEDGDDDDGDNKYRSDDNKTVYVAYENGTAFLLNFNSYAVTVVMNEVTYTIDAYGYLVLTAAN